MRFLKPEDLEVVIKKWNETDPEANYILVFPTNNEKKFCISYAREDYIYLLEPYDLEDVDYESYTPEQVLEHEVPKDREGYLYEKDSKGNIKLLAKIERRVENKGGK